MADYERLEKLGPLTISREVIERIPPRLCKEYKVFPLEETDAHLKLAMADIFDLAAIDDIQFLIKPKKVKPVQAPLEEIEKMIMKHYGVGATSIGTEKGGVEANGQTQLTQEIGLAENIDEVEQSEDSAVVNFVNEMFQRAIQMRASDIHVEPLPGDIRVRYKIDGMLREVPVPSQLKRWKMAVISRVKIMSKMDIAERRLPQDGRISLKSKGQEIDVRVNSIPTVHGESIALRLLNKSAKVYTLEEDGFFPEILKAWRKLIRNQNGIILVTGPTGSGKSTTLYSALSELNTPEKKIVTVEDPVEYQMPGVDQLQANEQIGLTFAVALRAFLRQNPTIIMVGEIRDAETAEIAIKASMTGHLVFSTLHTNDSCSAVTRIVDMGVEPFLVASTVRGVLAKRLARTVCPDCKTTYQPEPDQTKAWGMPVAVGEKIQVVRGTGCERCGNEGILGRMGVHELFLMNETLEDIVLKKLPASELKKAARKFGFRSLREDAWMKAKMGLIPVESVFQSTMPDAELASALQ